ncbi:hypothetical protein [Streptomyces sp. NPDC048659]|uniref:hypothetical protein n=1 Tax=Streptomyces sp. NPDC048659 TaxID=3155489 RepID=UPI0034194845
MRGRSRGRFGPALGLAVLRTPRTRYAVRVGADGSPRHLCWGRPLDVAVLAAPPADELARATPTRTDSGPTTPGPFAHYRDPETDEVHRGLDPRLPAGDHASRPIRLRRVDGA